MDFSDNARCKLYALDKKRFKNLWSDIAKYYNNNCHENSFEIKHLVVVPTVVCESESSISRNLCLDDFSMNNKKDLLI